MSDRLRPFFRLRRLLTGALTVLALLFIGLLLIPLLFLRGIVHLFWTGFDRLLGWLGA